MKKHYNVKENHPNYKGGKPHCKDCGKEIWWESIRCKHCARIYQYSIKPETNPFFGKKGKLSPSFKGGWKHFCVDCGKKIDFNAIRCQKHAKIEQYKNPENHPNWIDGRSYEDYPIEFNDSLKESIRKRDNYICQNCGITEEEHLIVLGRNLTIHHIDYNKKNCSDTNLITLCGSCNIRVNFNRSIWQELFTNLLLGIKWSRE